MARRQVAAGGMTKHRFAFLDFLRGVAAFSVLGLHLGLGFGLKHYPAHGYLAVDFFFCLSGFVLSHAYGARLQAGMPAREFARARLVRLYPMILAAAILAPLAYYGGGFAHPGFGQAAVLTAAGFLLLPAGLLFHQSAFVLNGPIWSLFFEWLANAAFFAEARAPMGRAAAFAVLAGFAAALAITILNVGSADAIGFASPASFLAGFARVLYSFLAGVLVERYRPNWRAPAWALTLVLVAVLYSGAGAGTPRYDVAAILLVFPAIVALGAGVGEPGRMAAPWRFMGDLSYPLYVMHEPVLRAVFAGFGRHAALIAAVAAVGVSYALLVLFDAPVRKYLSKRSLF